MPVTTPPVPEISPPPSWRDHWVKIVVLLGLETAFFLGIGFGLGWHRVRTDWWPLDQSTDGPNLLVSFVWVPMAIVGALIWADLRRAGRLAEAELQHARHLQETEEQHQRHLAEHVEHDEAHRLSMARILGVDDPDQAAMLSATPGDRSGIS